jgi:hypothetical protein
MLSLSAPYGFVLNRTIEGFFMYKDTIIKNDYLLDIKAENIKNINNDNFKKTQIDIESITNSKVNNHNIQST